MRVAVLKENLKSGLGSVERSISDHSTLPILKNVLIKTLNNKIEISATNLEMAVTHSISGKIFENGVITIPAQMFTSLITNLPSEKINLEKNNYNLVIKTDNYEALIQGLNPDDFPIIPRINNLAGSLKISTDIFRESLARVSSAAQFSEIRPEISCLLMNYQVDNLKLIATDSFRLAEKTIPANQFKSDLNESFKILIPLKTAHELLRILKNGGETEIFVDANQVLFKTPELEIISRLIDGQYPDYEAIIPKDIATEVIVNRNELIQALKLAGVFTSRSNEVKLKIGETKKYLEIYSADSALGENRYLVAIKANGPAVNIAFNLKYLLDGLKAYNSNEIIFALNSDNKPSLIKAPDDQSFFYILMPIKS